MNPKSTKATSLLPASWEVPPNFRLRLGHRVGRQRVMKADEHLLLVLHEPPAAEDVERVGRYFWRDASGNWTPKGLRHEDHAVEELIAEYERTIDRLDEREEAAESADDYFSIMRDLNPLVRAANNLHDTLQKAREEMPEARELISLRDAAYAMARRVELLAADTRHALDYHIAMRAEEQAESSARMAAASYRLNLLVAFFFPIATLAGIFGMNLHNPLEEMSRHTGGAFLVGVLIFGLLMGAVLIGFVVMPHPKRIRRKKRGKP